eukprot:TRINITY_DN7963_c0_g1_i3.p1 TRINITY_DN7963_c0_g1~~TRINITY_DN7963_c0_g1_i3.p1  ORF type:complete len:141 (+),score=8.67 TRINITY_DN7963_c0_g1_i3:184-606(+)
MIELFVVVDGLALEEAVSFAFLRVVERFRDEDIDDASAFIFAALPFLLANLVFFGLTDLGSGPAGCLSKTGLFESETTTLDGGANASGSDSAEVVVQRPSLLLSKEAISASKASNSSIFFEIGRAVQQECRDRSRMPSSA